MRVTILGTGAMACLFAARLAPVADVTVVGTWDEALAAIAAGGVVVESEAPRRVGVARLGAAVPPADLVLVLVKAWQTDAVAPHLASLLAPDGAAVTLQNGLGHRERFGPRARLGVTMLGATLLGPGRVRPGGAGTTYVAGPAWIAAVLGRAGLAARVVDEAEAERLAWGKLAVNCAINPLTALLRVPNGALLERADAGVLMDRAAAECAAVARASGITLPWADPVAYAREVAARTAANRSSMLQDVLRGAPTEIDAINGAVVREAERRGVPAPVNHVLWRLVRALR